jgi:hypothetical protein
MTRMSGRLALLALLLVANAHALAQSDEATRSARPTLSAGVKLWANTWDTWVTNRTGTGVALGTQRYQTVQALDSDLKVSPIPFVSFRYSDFFASVSAMTRTHYKLLDTASPGGFEVGASRQEADFNSGYFVLPGLALTLGYKQVKQTYGPDSYRWRGPIVGASGSAGLAGAWSIYGTAALGFMKADFPAVQADSTGKTKFDADYRLGEFGLAYAMAINAKFVRSVVATVGYRFQNVATKDYGLAVTDPQGNFATNATSDLKDTTQGFALGLYVAF